MGSYTYESLVCRRVLYGVKPSLRDPWAFVISLLAVRSPLALSTANYRDLPDVGIKYTRLIRRHRDAASVDLWRGRHLPDGSLVPLSPVSSSTAYKSIIRDTYLDEVMTHSGIKFHDFLTKNSHVAPPPPSEVITTVSQSLTSTKAPSFLLAHHFNVINNALATSRRMRHQNGIRPGDVPSCFFCGDGEDSLTHVLSECAVVYEARLRFLGLLGLSPGPFTLPSPTLPAVSDQLSSHLIPLSPPPGPSAISVRSGLGIKRG